MSKKRKVLSEEEVSSFIEECGYKFISTYMENRIRMIEFICPNGHTETARYNNFKTRRGSCFSCKKENNGKGNRKSENDVIGVFEEYGFELVSSIDEYKGNRSILSIKCPNEHILHTSTRLFTLAKVKCRECAGKVNFDIESVKIAFSKQNYQLLEDTYINTTTKMKYICNKHPNEVRELSLNEFQNGSGCKSCANDFLAELKKTPYNEVAEEFSKKNYVLISTSYKNSSIPLEFICKNHEELGVQQATYNSIKQSRDNCEGCKDEKIRRGEDNPNWKGGKSVLSNYLRKAIDSWKEESMKNSGYRCVITGDYFDVIHHLYSFNKIVTEVLDTLNLEQHSTLEKYSPKEIREIRVLNLKLHFDYGLGVCLSKSVHDLFHDIYGKYDNSPEQFEEFKMRYENGEFDEILSERGLGICE